MGYYTRYELSKDSSRAAASAAKQNSRVVSEILESDISPELKKELVHLAQEKYKVPDVLDIDCQDYFGHNPFSGEPTKWYSHEEDMKVLSKDFPGVVFVLTGYGEESEDIWRKYFCDGKMQTSPAKITFEDFDPGKLV